MTPSLLNSSLVLPALTTLIGTGGLTVGIYSFLNPSAAAGIYGIPIAVDSLPESVIPDLTTFLQKSPSEPESKTSQPSTQSQQPLDDRHRALLHSLAIRNLTTGVTILTLTAIYSLSLKDTNITDPLIVCIRQILGIVIMIGSWVPMVDAVVCRGTPGEFGGRTGLLHVGRAVVWVGVGVWAGFGGRGTATKDVMEAVLNEGVKDVVRETVSEAFKDCFSKV